MRSFVSLIAAIALFVSADSASAQSAAAPAPDSAHLRLAKELIHVSGADSAVVKGVELMISMQRTTNTQAPTEFWDEFLKRVRADLPKLIDALAPIYAAHFSKDEIKQLKTFYQSPIGRRMVAEMIPLQRESSQAGMKWGAAIGGEVMASQVGQ